MKQRTRIYYSEDQKNQMSGDGKMAHNENRSS